MVLQIYTSSIILALIERVYCKWLSKYYRYCLELIVTLLSYVSLTKMLLTYIQIIRCISHLVTGIVITCAFLPSHLISIIHAVWSIDKLQKIIMVWVTQCNRSCGCFQSPTEFESSPFNSLYYLIYFVVISAPIYVSSVVCTVNDEHSSDKPNHCDDS
ncbi:hypothetical protein EDC96DRAFT_545559 [Choanephora cucurbitarum]|nr:hypothetical protein EDC96DRAFT_545559 [Choanephora cucurbitarum]